LESLKLMDENDRQLAHASFRVQSSLESQAMESLRNDWMTSQSQSNQRLRRDEED